MKCHTNVPHSADERLPVTMNAFNIRRDDVITRCRHLALARGHDEFLSNAHINERKWERVLLVLVIQRVAFN